MEDDRKRNDSPQEQDETGANDPDSSKSSAATLDGIANKPQMEQVAQTEDKARTRLMEISQALPLGDKLDSTSSSAQNAASALPRVDSKDEIRRKLMSISYSDVDQPLPMAGQPVGT